MSDRSDLAQVGTQTISYGKPADVQRPEVYLTSDTSGSSGTGRPDSGEIPGHEPAEVQLMECHSDSWQNGSGPYRDRYIMPEPQRNRPSMYMELGVKTADDCMYQSLEELNLNCKNENVNGFEKAPLREPHSHSYKFHMLLLTFLITVLALLVGAGSLGIGLYHWPSATESATVMDLQKQLMVTQVTINELTASVAELHSALYPDEDSMNKNRMESLMDQVDAFSVALEDIVPSLNELELYTNCTIQHSTCSIGTEPRCTTSMIPHTSEGYQNINVHCAITNSREERNPMVATLNVNENDNKMSCSCYIIDLGSARNTVECSLLVKRCPNYFL